MNKLHMFLVRYRLISSALVLALMLAALTCRLRRPALFFAKPRNVDRVALTGPPQAGARTVSSVVCAARTNIRVPKSTTGLANSQ